MAGNVCGGISPYSSDVIKLREEYRRLKEEIESLRLKFQCGEAEKGDGKKIKRLEKIRRKIAHELKKSTPYHNPR